MVAMVGRTLRLASSMMKIFSKNKNKNLRSALDDSVTPLLTLHVSGLTYQTELISEGGHDSKREREREREIK